MSLYVCAYDVSDDGRRARLAKRLRREGVRVQKSVFEVNLTPAGRRQLLRDVAPHLAREDAFDLFPLDTRPGRERLRWQQAPEPWDALVMA